MWIKLNELIKIEVDGISVGFYPIKRDVRFELQRILKLNDEGKAKVMYDFVEEHIIEIDGVKEEDVSLAIQFQHGNMISLLFASILNHGTLSKEASENLGLPLGSSKPELPTAIVQDVAKEDVSTNQKLSQQGKTAKMSQG